uniref:Uncharacterized protein n=1 Tax=Castor canadensis TaxID=51338 RepID=A0A8C0WC19_CASCN
MQSSFPGCLANQLVLQFQANKVDICAVVLCHQPTHKFHFLTGCGETLLSHFYKCPVWNHLQTVPIKVHNLYAYVPFVYVYLLVVL